MRLFKYCTAFYFFLSSFSLEARIYKYEKSDGTIVYTNKKPASQKNYKKLNSSSLGKRYSVLYLNGKIKEFSPSNKIKKKYIPIIKKNARKHNVHPALIYAIIEAESSFRERAISAVGAQGLMQLMPKTAKELGIKDPFDARQNIFGGTLYLKRMLKLFKQDMSLAVAAYNAGPGAVKKYKGIPPFKETENYVDKVMWLYYKYLRDFR